ncbi:aldo/keto reductase [Rhizosphaericola mali]|uniref:Aldo/keto reductase n=1 Tax=Rhizosphaericola mali TaxID=2545455 RepID=A0A5P2G3G8_9BACT|nr:aldo/keto reductase [Rhizosphaericola mali]QES88350.1 aldo/keto reductase [Rhizosphaericola mali]
MNKLPAIALGTWSWVPGEGDTIFGNNITSESLQPVFAAGIKAGLELWDTAFVYGMGASESIVGDFISQYPREEITLSTKFTPQLAPNTENPVLDMLEGSLLRLCTDYVDIYWIHNPTDAPKWTPALIPLLESGKVKSVGVSNHNLEQIKEADAILKEAGFHISAVQNHYSLLYRSSEEAGILDYCKENDITFFSYMVLEQGALSGKYNTQNPLPEGSLRGETYNKILPQIEELTNAMKEIGGNRNVSVAQVAIAWAIAKNTLPIIGVTKVSQVEDAVGAVSIKLSTSEIEKMENLAAMVNVNTRGFWEKPMV